MTTNISDFQVLMSNSNESNWYTLLAGGTDESKSASCVTDLTLYGGVQQPFETLTLTIPRNRLKTYAPGLIDDISAGRNRVKLTGFGDGTYTVVKCKLRSKTYTVTAYSDAEKVRGYTLSSDISGTSVQVINEILTKGNYGLSYSDSSIVRWYDDSNAVSIEFEAGTNAWYALQVAAMSMGCRVWFADAEAYIADLRGDFGSASDSEHWLGEVDLYPSDTTDWMYNRVADSPELGDEGVDTVVNSIQITYSDGGDDGGTKTGTWMHEESVDLYGERSATPLTLSSLNLNAAEAFAEAYLDYRKEPQQSVTFTLKEYSTSASNALQWSASIPPLAFATSITSGPDEFTVTNTSDIDGSTALQKLTLSEYVRSYPEGTTEYSFGILENIDLSTSTSQILSSRVSR